MKKTGRSRITGIIAFAMVIVMGFAFGGCGSDQQDENAGGNETANPITEVKDAEALVQKTGVEIKAPEGAEGAVYSYIEGESEESIIGQVQFTLDGVEYCYRAMSTGMLSMDEYIADGEYSDLAGAMMDGAEVGTDISGMYGPWDAAALITVQDRDGVCAINEGAEGVILWLDVVPGIMYSLSANDGAEQSAMMDLAEEIFVPVQGEVG